MMSHRLRFFDRWPNLLFLAALFGTPLGGRHAIPIIYSGPIKVSYANDVPPFSVFWTDGTTYPSWQPWLVHI